MSLTYIGQQITIYGGLFVLVTGVVGNGINIFIFSTVRNYRTTPSPFYFLVESIINLIFLMINLTFRLNDAINGGNFSDRSIIWCKTRPFISTTLSLISFSCCCLALIDQFLVTSQNVRLRQLSKIQRTYRIVFFVIIIWCLHGIPAFFYLDIRDPQYTCTNTNVIYQTYNIIYSIVHTCAIPVLVLLIFGSLTYRNIRQTRVLVEQHADRQLVKMTLIKVFVVVTTITPVGIMYAYNFITSGITKNTNQKVKEGFAFTIASLIYYIYYSGGFCVYFISSSRFRRTVKERILWWQRRNQLYPHNI